MLKKYVSLLCIASLLFHPLSAIAQTPAKVAREGIKRAAENPSFFVGAPLLSPVYQVANPGWKGFASKRLAPFSTNPLTRTLQQKVLIYHPQTALVIQQPTYQILSQSEIKEGVRLGQEKKLIRTLFQVGIERRETFALGAAFDFIASLFAAERNLLSTDLWTRWASDKKGIPWTKLKGAIHAKEEWKEVIFYAMEDPHYLDDLSTRLQLAAIFQETMEQTFAQLTAAEKEKTLSELSESMGILHKERATVTRAWNKVEKTLASIVGGTVLTGTLYFIYIVCRDIREYNE